MPLTPVRSYCAQSAGLLIYFLLVSLASRNLELSGLEALHNGYLQWHLAPVSMFLGRLGLKMQINNTKERNH
jgi:hypothetical protein